MSYDNYKQLIEQTLEYVAPGEKCLHSLFAILDARFEFMEHELEVLIESKKEQIDQAAELFIEDACLQLQAKPYKLHKFIILWDDLPLFVITIPGTRSTIDQLIKNNFKESGNVFRTRSFVNHYSCCNFPYFSIDFDFRKQLVYLSYQTYFSKYQYTGWIDKDDCHCCIYCSGKRGYAIY